MRSQQSPRGAATPPTERQRTRRRNRARRAAVRPERSTAQQEGELGDGLAGALADAWPHADPRGVGIAADVRLLRRGADRMSGVVAVAAAAAVTLPLHGEIRPLQAIVRDQATMVQAIEQGSQLRVQMPGDVLFAFGSARLTPRCDADAADRRARARGPGAGRVVVEGHTDARGGDAFNRRLAARRGRAVAVVLRTDRPGTRFVVRAYGEARPVASNATAAGRAQNRRVELRLE